MIDSLLNISPKYMENNASSQPEHPCIVNSTRDTLKHLELNDKRMEKSQKWRRDNLPWLAFHPTYCLFMTWNMWHHPNQVYSTLFPQFSKANGIQYIIWTRCIIWTSSINNCCFNNSFHCPPFLYNKNCPFGDSHPDFGVNSTIVLSPLQGDCPTFWVVKSTRLYSQTQGMPFPNSPTPLQNRPLA